jgi:CBS domain-containing protein
MRISDVLRGNGSGVATIAPEATVKDLVGELAKHNVGAVVVVVDGAVVGVVSERDVVRKLNESGVAVLDAPVAEIMTTSVFTCAPGDSVDDLAAIMTERRIRHIPVVVHGKLIGIVSIGDVVKSRIDQLVTDREQLESYIAHG